MASVGSTLAVIARRNDQLTLLPAPSTTRIKRPAVVLDEDDYTDGLSDIIARDYYPGLRVAQAQQDYLKAVDSGNQERIKRTGAALISLDADANIQVAQPKKLQRDTRFDTPRSYRKPNVTPRRLSGDVTPIKKEYGSQSEDEIVDHEDRDEESEINDSGPVNLSLTDFQSNFTSEDNESFNKMIDKQNEKRRNKYAYLYTPDQRLPSKHTLQQQERKFLLTAESGTDSEQADSLVPLTIGATSDRPALLDSWKNQQPTNNLMFIPQTSVDKEGLASAMDIKESLSKAGPKEIVHANTRFPASGPRYAAEDANDTASLRTSNLARNTAEGSETPRVNGYSFVDEDDEPPVAPAQKEPSYRDLLAGQAGSTNNPFKLGETRAREDLHHRMVEKNLESRRRRNSGRTPTYQSIQGKNFGCMTPAGQRLLGRLGSATPVRISSDSTGQPRDMWTPAATPRRM